MFFNKRQGEILQSVSPKEIPWIHLTRVIACIMVVCLHVGTAAKMYPMRECDRFFNSCMSLCTIPCVTLFFIITGFLILPYKDGENIKNFYKKRIPRVLFPLICWGVIYAVLPFLIGLCDKSMMLKELILSPVKTPSIIGGILWYLFILIGIYLAIPFLTNNVYKSTRLLVVYLGFWLASCLFYTMRHHIPGMLGNASNLHSFNMLVYFSGYMGFLLFGYAAKKYGNQFCSIMNRGGNACILILMFILGYNITTLVHGFLAIGTVVTALCLFILLYKIRINETSMMYRIIKNISTASFGIYLCHMLILKVLTENLFFISASWIMQILCMVSTFLISFIIIKCLSMLPFRKYIIG